MAPSTSTAMRDLGPAPTPGHRLVLLLLEEDVVQQWILDICPEGSVHRMIAGRPAENIILSLSQEVPLRTFLTEMEENATKCLGVLIASRGCAQDELCVQCTGTNGTAPFESCFLVDGLEVLGCASCKMDGDDNMDDDDEIIADRCSHGDAAVDKLPDADSSDSSLDD